MASPRFAAYLCVLLCGISAAAQSSAPAIPSREPEAAGQNLEALPLNPTPPSVMFGAQSPIQPLLDFKQTDIKFNLQTLMSTLRDNRHEGWVLAAYPDPKTSRPLIGAGFSLDLPAREHLQRDASNPDGFLEPSSAQLWQAAGLPPERLQSMLDQFDRELAAWKKRQFQRKVRAHALFPEIEEDDAVKLLRISAIQAVHNARAYCRHFDNLNGPQQMALTQLVFQMGVNLEQFTQFLWAINNPPAFPYATQNTVAQASVADLDPQLVPAALTGLPDAEYWNAVQATLIHSDWARRYSTRAISVIAMFDPEYATAPWEAESRVRAQVRPLRRSRRHAAAVRTAGTHKKPNSGRSHKS